MYEKDAKSPTLHQARIVGIKVDRFVILDESIAPIQTNSIGQRRLAVE